MIHVHRDDAIGPISVNKENMSNFIPYIGLIDYMISTITPIEKYVGNYGIYIIIRANVYLGRTCNRANGPGSRKYKIDLYELDRPRFRRLQYYPVWMRFLHCAPLSLNNIIHQTLKHICLNRGFLRSKNDIDSMYDQYKRDWYFFSHVLQADLTS
jgi:hypothetical protein